MSSSCAYEGWVRHRRHDPAAHELRMRLFMVYLDLAELPALFDGWRVASARGRALAEFRRADHLGDPGVPLARAVRELVAQRTGTAPDGPIRLLTGLRYLGCCFNPVSFYYCFGGEQELETVVAEVTNTPWGERHAYVLAPDRHDARAKEVVAGRFAKEFHVSPFMGMDHVYDWRTTMPADRLIVHIDSRQGERRAFDATLTLRRRELSAASLARLMARYPALSAQILGRIYLHGARLWAKGARYHPNPSGAAAFGRWRRAGARHDQPLR
jgi:DUF1365 family protein